MGGGSPNLQASQPAQIQAGKVEVDAANAGLFERMKRAMAYGKQKTMITSGILPAPQLESKTLLAG